MLSYLSWHYGEGLSCAVRAAVRAVSGFFNYFSILWLARTLFSPWHRVAEAYGRGFDPNRFFAVLAANLISRVLGAIVRSVVIAVGLGVSAGAAVAGFGFIAAWLTAPLLIPLLFLWGLFLL